MEMKQRMERTNKAMGEALVQIEQMKERLEGQYREDREYLKEIGMDIGTTHE